MDTPDSKSTPANNSKFKLINPSPSDSSAFQDSPVFNYISNLSPIEHVKAGPVAQGFPGLASPPLVFTSPRINSITSFFNRKLQSSGPNSEFSQDHEYCQKNEKDSGDSVKLNPEFQSPLVPSDQKTCNTEKLVLASHCSPSVCFDEFFVDPGQYANPSNKIQSDDAHPSVEGSCLEKTDVSNVKDVGLVGSGLQRGKQSAQAKSRISVKLVKNNARHLISSSGCSGALSRSLTDDKSDTCHTGDSSSEACQFDRGTLRRCLFDESQRKYSAVGSGFRNSTATAQIPESANMSTEKSGNRQIINQSKPAASMSVPPVTGSYPAVNSKPLGIGLHLNSVVYPRTTDGTVGSEQSSVVRVEGRNSISVRSNESERKVKGTNVITKVLANSEESSQHQTCLGSDNTIASDAIEQSNNAVEMKLDASTVQYHKRKFSSDLDENNESSLASPKKKRKKASSSTDDDTTKRCNCKKTKCLKLYCDCFAAGFYCGESCACQGCFNRPENEDTVLETRQQIESRNPLAFAPKVMQPVADSPASIKEIGNLSTPSSARHKRGCNCKKSMCLKKYCECYQANVGCSEGCRCEGCKNIYGIREDYSIAREILIKRTSVEMSEGSMTVSSSSASSRAHNSPNLIPVTPALQCSDQKKNTAKSRLPFRRFLQSSDSQQDTLTSGDNLASPKNSQNHCLLLEKSKCMEFGILDADEAFENADDRLVPADESMYAPSPPQSSNADATDSNFRNTSQPEFIEESGPPPPISSSLRWRSSPITPITQLDPSELKDFGSVSKHSDMLEDDTPEILKPSSTPVESVKVSSPNKKRISPPHNNMNSSESLRSSRKFLLRALPAFPSLTPYSKNGSHDSRGQT